MMDHRVSTIQENAMGSLHGGRPAGRPSQQASRTGAAARQLGMLQLILSLSFWHGKRAQGNARAVSDWNKKTAWFYTTTGDPGNWASCCRVSCPRRAPRRRGVRGARPGVARGRAGGRGNPCAAGDGRGCTALLGFFFREGMWIVRLQRTGGGAVFLFDCFFLISNSHLVDLKLLYFRKKKLVRWRQYCLFCDWRSGVERSTEYRHPRANSSLSPGSDDSA